MKSCKSTKTPNSPVSTKGSFKKKGFLIDKISEDSFYENLLLGFPSILKTCPFVSQIKLDRFPPATVDEVLQWEYKNVLRLPSDLCNFFLSTNGFSFTYKFSLNKSEDEDVDYLTGGIDIHPLFKIEQIPITDAMFFGEKRVRSMSVYSKVFPLTKLEDDSFTVLAQLDPNNPPNIWFCYKLKSFYYLCEDFITYFRMALAHAGVPGWPLSVLGGNLPEWSAEMIRLIAPGTIENRFQEKRDEINFLDENVFAVAENEANPTEGDSELRSNYSSTVSKKSKKKSK